MLEAKELFEMTLQVSTEKMINIGALPHGGRRIVPISGGRFSGDRLNGRVLPGGADWVLVEPDGSFRIDVRLTLETDDSQSIYMQYDGLFYAEADVLERYYSGASISEDEYYLRTQARFETSASNYQWLNHIVSVGKGRKIDGGVSYQMYHVL
ncbi:DUF3237 domain-containing protein [Arenicella sp. 4NH20-0111]|uniref:DUF3237 domain-containing protein n=1 Tax=Arenicella sp. 4NH20-0111 TaxID=3127648 RepID=UPI003104C9DC